MKIKGERICCICGEPFVLNEKIDNRIGRTICYNEECVQKFTFLAGIGKRPKPIRKCRKCGEKFIDKEKHASYHCSKCRGKKKESN